jgi:hypothetical protein
VLVIEQYFSKELIALHCFCKQLGTILARVYLNHREEWKRRETGPKIMPSDVNVIDTMNNFIGQILIN